MSITVIDPFAGGIGLVKAGEAVTIGHYVHVDGTNGKAQGSAALTAGRFYIGIAMEAAAAADEIFQVKLGTIET